MTEDGRLLVADFSRLKGETIRFLDYNTDTKAVEEFTGVILSVFFCSHGDAHLCFILLCQRGEEKFLKNYEWNGEEELTVIRPSFVDIPGY